MWGEVFREHRNLSSCQSPVASRQLPVASCTGFFHVLGRELAFLKPMSMIQFVIRHSSFVIILLLLFSLGCQKKSTIEAPAEVPSPSVSSAPPAITPAVPDSSNTTLPDSDSPAKAAATFNSFDLGEADFYAGKYQQAALSFESFLDANPESENRDQALFLMALSRALAGDSVRNQRQSEAALKQLISEFPDSPYRKQAEYILGLRTRIEKLEADVRERNKMIKELSEELKRLKQIDLQRRPTRK
jgi:tetratricopeptide (TPR) repeat protein